ncbi:MAG: transposase [Bacteroidetes bacterium]|nr:MAG: transposase [Bacteroidota bacterium]
MGRKYKIWDSDRLYFVTFTIVEWIRIFDIEANMNIIIDSIKYCQEHKGLEVYAWVVMPNHLHMIIGRKGEPTLSQIIGDLKSFTSRQIRKELKEGKESLAYQILVLNGLKNSRNQDFQLWQQHSHPIEITSDYMFDQKANYIHLNPVEAGIVDHPEHWEYSSAIDYHGGKGLLDITSE